MRRRVFQMLWVGCLFFGLLFLVCVAGGAWFLVVLIVVERSFFAAAIAGSVYIVALIALLALFWDRMKAAVSWQWRQSQRVRE